MGAGNCSDSAQVVSDAAQSPCKRKGLPAKGGGLPRANEACEEASKLNDKTVDSDFPASAVTVVTAPVVDGRQCHLWRYPVLSVYYY